MLENTEEATSECLLIWAWILEVQRVQGIVLNSIKEAKVFNAMLQKYPKMQMWDHTQWQMQVL